MNGSRQRGIGESARNLDLSLEKIANLSGLGGSMKQLLMADRKTVHQPDIETPFQDAADVVRRLLPYHIFNHPQSELEHAIATGRRLSKGKEKEVDLPANLQALALENEGTLEPPWNQFAYRSAMANRPSHRSPAPSQRLRWHWTCTSKLVR